MVTISLPREAQTLSTSRSYYNANNGDQQDVGPEVLKHTIGSPFSYPTEGERDQQLTAAVPLFRNKPLPSSKVGGWKSPHTISVGPGGADSYETLRIEYTQSDKKTVALEMSAELSAEVSGGVIVQASGSTSGGLQGGVSVSTTITKGFFVEGQIGAIPQQKFNPDKRYVAGLFAYPKQIDKQGVRQEFMVVNYWVTR
jgi:hypothetical protein